MVIYTHFHMGYVLHGFRFMEPITSKIPLMVIEGNHEIEPQGHGGEVTFASYLARFAVPSNESGSNTKFYYSFNAGGIHFIMLGAYVNYNHTGNNLFTTVVSSLCTISFYCHLLIIHIHLNMIRNVVLLSFRPCRPYVPIFSRADKVAFWYVHCLQEFSTRGWRRICRGLIDESPLGLWLLGIHLGITAIPRTTRNLNA